MSEKSEKAKTAIWDIIDAISKTAIPIVLAVMVWVQNDHLNKQQKDQNDYLIKQQEKQTNRDTQLKLIELTWNSLTGEDEHAKTISMKLLKSLDPVTASTIASAVFQDSTQSKANRQEAAQLTVDLSSEKLRNIKIDIYYSNEDPKALVLATKMQEAIAKKRLDNKILLIGKNLSWAKRVALPSGNEVRYETSSEEEMAQALAGILNTANSVWDCKLRPVYTPTPGTISVIISQGFN